MLFSEIPTLTLSLGRWEITSNPLLNASRLSPMTNVGSKDNGFESIREIKILFGREPTMGTLEKGLVLKRLSKPNLIRKFKTRSSVLSNVVSISKVASSLLFSMTIERKDLLSPLLISEIVPFTGDK